MENFSSKNSLFQLNNAKHFFTRHLINLIEFLIKQNWPFLNRLQNTIMNQVKSLINETKSFPPYYQMIDALNMNLDSEKKIVEGLSSFLNQPLEILYETQPKELEICIKEIQKAVKKQKDVMQNMISTQSIIPNTMSILLSIYKEIAHELSIISDAREVAIKSQAAMDKSVQNLNKIKKQKVIDQSKLEGAEKEVTKNTDQYESDNQTAENIQREKSQTIIELRKKFVESLAISLKSFAQVKEAVAKDLAQVSTELTNSLLFLDPSNDPSFASLEDRLKQLNDEKID